MTEKFYDPKNHYHYNHNLPEAEILLSEHSAGSSWKQIAEKYKVSESTIWTRIRIYHDITSGKRNPIKVLSGADNGMFREDLDTRKMIDDYEGGLTTSEIASKYNCGKTTVKRKLKNSGVQMRKQVAAPKIPKPEKVKIEKISYPAGVIVDNKYSKIYWQIIERARTRITHPDEKYYEDHHAQPKALGGSDDPANLVLLTGREHYICHHLLTKCTFGDDKRRMVHAWHLMCFCDKTGKRFIPAFQYEHLKRELASVGKSDEHKAKMSEAAKKRKPRVFSEQAKKNMSASRRKEWAEGKYSKVDYKGIPKSAEWKKKMSDIRKANPWSTKKKEVNTHNEGKEEIN